MVSKLTNTLTIWPRKKEVLEAVGRSPHIDNEYDLLEDSIDEGGIRIIRLKKRDKTETQKMIEEIAREATKSMGEGESKVVKEIFIDSIRDYTPSKLKNLYNKIVLKKVPVKPRGGCFKFIVGKDGREKSSEVIMIG